MTDSTTKKPAELESLRADIDRSDEAIVGALRTRLGAVRRIAEVKRLQGLPVYDAVREASLLYKLRSMAGSDVEGVALPVYRTMMAAARRFEAQSQEAVFHPEHLDAHSSSPGSQTAENEPGQSLEGKKCSGKRVFPGTGPYKKPPD